MSFFYPLKVNWALAAMSITPGQFNGEWRSGMQQIGKANGCTPEETALAIAGLGLGINIPDNVELAISVWQKDGKIDINKPEVSDALQRMGFDLG